MRNNTFMRKAISVSVAVSLMMAPMASFPADFMDNFFSSGGAQYNVTAAGVYQGNSLGVYTGGGVVYKAPQRDFQPFYFAPPSLKAGCGGIDVFLGSFGLPSKAEFVAFMRNIGQNLPGLAFKLALQELSPDFQAMMEQIRTSLQNYNHDYTNSCKAAQALLDNTGASDWIRSTAAEARNSLRELGGSSDQATADEETKADYSKVQASVPNKKIKNPGAGTETELSNMTEVNITWFALNSGELEGMDDAEKQFLMSVLGTTVYKNSGTDANSVPLPNDYGGNISAEALLGKFSDTSIPNLRLFKCATETVKCIDVVPDTTTSVQPMAAKMYNVAKKVRDSILTRTKSFSDADLAFLQSSSSVPLVKLITLTTYGRLSAFSEDMLIVWTEIAAYELLTRYLEDASQQASKLMTATMNNTAFNAQVKTKAEDLKKHLADMRKEMMARRGEIDNKFQKTAATMEIMMNVERALRQTISADMAKNMDFRG